MTAEEYIKEWLPKMEGWCTAEKAAHMVQAIKSQKPKLAVEIGIFGGRSLFAIAFAMKDLGHCQTWGIDPWSVEAAIEGDVGRDNELWWSSKVNLEKIHRGFVSDYLALELGPYCRWIREKSERAIRMFDDKSIDFFHLDSNHSEQVSCRDVEAWHPKLKHNSIWVMDDTDWESQQKAVDKIMELGFGVVIDGGTYQILKRDANSSAVLP